MDFDASPPLTPCDPLIEREEPAFVFLKPEELTRKYASLIESASELLAVPRIAAHILLQQHKWHYTLLGDKVSRGDQTADDLCRTAGFSLTAGKADVPAGQKLLNCTVCLGPRSFDDAFAPKKCGHFFCNECWRGHVRNMLSDKLPPKRFTCIQPGCDVLLSEPDITLLFGNETKDIALYQAATEELVSEFTRSNHAIKICPGNGCGKAVYCTELDQVCVCSRRWCFSCHSEAIGDHRPAACSDVFQWIRKEMELSEQSWKWIRENTRQCPSCNVRIEKAQGCMHIACTQCKFQFCWLCKNEWKDHKAKECNKCAPTPDQDVDGYLFFYSRFDSWKSALENASARVLEFEKVFPRSNTEIARMQSHFVILAWHEVLESRRVLQWSYAYSFFNTKMPKRERDLFIFCQSDLELLTNRLSKLIEANPSSVGNVIQYKAEVLRMTDACNSYRIRFVGQCKDGLTGAPLDVDVEDQRDVAPPPSGKECFCPMCCTAMDDESSAVAHMLSVHPEVSDDKKETACYQCCFPIYDDNWNQHLLLYHEREDLGLPALGSAYQAGQPVAAVAPPPAAAGDNVSHLNFYAGVNLVPSKPAEKSEKERKPKDPNVPLVREVGFRVPAVLSSPQRPRPSKFYWSRGPDALPDPNVVAQQADASLQSTLDDAALTRQLLGGEPPWVNLNPSRDPSFYPLALSAGPDGNEFADRESHYTWTCPSPRCGTKNALARIKCRSCAWDKLHQKPASLEFLLTLTGLKDPDEVNNLPKFDKLLIPEDTVVVSPAFIGTGNSGRVYTALAYGKQRVAVKVFLDSVLPEIRLKDAAQLKLISDNITQENANIVRVLGIFRVIQGDALVTEYVKGRSLKPFLQSEQAGSITELHLCNFAKGIARGMQFLTSQSPPVYAALNLRNVLVGGYDEGNLEWEAKISDYGRDISDYLKPEYSRWVDPEVVRSHKLTSETEVWSFGVTVWELFTRGRVTPYWDIEDEMVVPMVVSGTCLESDGNVPHSYNIPQDIFGVVMMCMMSGSDLRPSFETLVKKFRCLPATWRPERRCPNCKEVDPLSDGLGFCKKCLAHVDQAAAAHELTVDLRVLAAPPRAGSEWEDIPLKEEKS